jgi:hypothetical protein
MEIRKVRITKPTDLLSYWEECHGKLENEEWRKLFLTHECIQDVLKHRQERILVAVRRNIKLHDILEDLYKQDDRHLEFLDKYYPYRDSQPDELKSRIEQRERDSGRWGRRF